MILYSDNVHDMFTVRVDVRNDVTVVIYNTLYSIYQNVANFNIILKITWPSILSWYRNPAAFLAQSYGGVANLGVCHLQKIL